MGERACSPHPRLYAMGYDLSPALRASAADRRSSPLEGGQGLYDFHGFNAHANDLAHEADDVFGVVGTVGVAANAAVLIFGHLILVNHPFERAAIAQAVFKGFGRNAASLQYRFGGLEG
jgi:hypothetical protein